LPQRLGLGFPGYGFTQCHDAFTKWKRAIRAVWECRDFPKQPRMFASWHMSRRQRKGSINGGRLEIAGGEECYQSVKWHSVAQRLDGQ